MIKINMATGKTIIEESFEYDGPLALAVSSVSGYGDPGSAYDDYSSTGPNKPDTKTETNPNNTDRNNNEDSNSSEYSGRFRENYDLGANDYTSRFNNIGNKVDRSMSEYIGSSEAPGQEIDFHDLFSDPNGRKSLHGYTGPPDLPLETPRIDEFDIALAAYGLIKTGLTIGWGVRSGLRIASKRTNFRQYEVLSEQPISGTSRSAHRASANRNLMNEMQQNPDLANELNKELGTDVAKHMRSGKSGLKNPPGTEWHHPSNNPNSMQLLRTGEHRNSQLGDVLHPNNIGGFGTYYGP